MRLTDLVRNQDGGQRKRKQSSAVSGAFDNNRALPPQDSQAAEQQSGFLQGDDLSALYDLSAPLPPSGNRQAQPMNNNQAQPAYQQVPPQMPPSYIPENADIPKSPFAEVAPSHDVPPPVQALETPLMASPPQPEVEEAPEPAANRFVADPSKVKSATSMEEYENFEEMGLADALHIELLSLLDDIYEDGKEGNDIFLERLIEPLAKTIDHERTSNALLRKAVRLKKGGRSFTSHSLNVGILAIKIGIKRSYTDEKLFSLALCALLGDIGMTRVDPDILNKSGKLTQEEFMEIKRHVEYSAEIVSESAAKFPFLGPIIYQIHERENGSGYPQGLKGANIHEFAKIIGMCDVYIALTEPKANRENYSGYVAMQQIISRRGIDFDAKVIKSLIDVISVFPLESLVKLNNGAIGRVIDISGVHPTRPKLSVLINGDGEMLSRPAFLDLEKEPLLYIEGPDIEEGVLNP